MTRLYIAVALALALTGVTGGVYLAGRSHGAAACEARWQTREGLRLQREAEIAHRRDQRLAEEREAADQRTRERIHHLEQDLAAEVERYEQLARVPDNGPCELSDIDARGLSNIR